MNLDFNRPKPKAKELAMEMGIDLTDPVVISEFQKLQRDRLQEMKDIRDGKKVKFLITRIYYKFRINSFLIIFLEAK